MSDDAINKIINNPNNYRLEENKMKTRKIIREVIEEFIQNEFRGGKNDDVIEITDRFKSYLKAYTNLDDEIDKIFAPEDNFNTNYQPTRTANFQGSPQMTS